MTRTGLPTRWHEVTDQRTGDVLYWRREHSGYTVYPVGALGRDGHTTRYEVRLDDGLVGELHDTLTHAIVAARDHMHENSSPTAL